MLRRSSKIKINSSIIFNTFDLPRDFMKMIQNRCNFTKSNYVCHRGIVDNIQFKEDVSI